VHLVQRLRLGARVAAPFEGPPSIQFKAVPYWSMAEMWTAEQCAEHAGVKVKTWTSYVARGQAPSAWGYDSISGRQVWRANVVREWHGNRPGKGARTDLS
jgi:hypothetical protein